jgi:endonuclease/exonuclease/phosphatase family metal-dependent hydrolase
LRRRNQNKSCSIFAAAFLGLLLLAHPLFGAEETYSILTWNVGLFKAFGQSIVKGADSRAGVIPQELKRFVKTRNVDVVFLQEVWSRHDGEAIIAAVNAHDEFDVFFPSGRVPFGFRSGTLLLVRKSRLQLDTKRRFVPYSWGARNGLEKLLYKGRVEALLSPQQVCLPPINFTGTHMQCITVSPEGKSVSEGERKAYDLQTEELGTGVDMMARNVRPSLIVGDINTGPTLGRAQFEILKTRLKGVNAVLSREPHTAKVTWSRANALVRAGHYSTDPDALVDHVFLRSCSYAVLQPGPAEIVFTETYQLTDDQGKQFESPLSDHYGLLVEIRLSSK